VGYNDDRPATRRAVASLRVNPDIYRVTVVARDAAGDRSRSRVVQDQGQALS
jgi:hypothetical protein